MSVKSSISLTDTQHTFARGLVEQGRYPSVSAVLQQGLELLRLQTESATEAEAAGIAALRALVSARREGAFICGAAMKDRISAMAAKARREQGV